MPLAVPIPEHLEDAARLLEQALKAGRADPQVAYMLGVCYKRLSKPGEARNAFRKIANPDELYKEDVLSTMRYLKLRKIKRLMEENQQDLGKPHTDEELMVLLQTHKHLKEIERSIMQDLGTVIVK